jgi:hypothetical protein
MIIWETWGDFESWEEMVSYVEALDDRFHGRTANWGRYQDAAYRMRHAEPAQGGGWIFEREPVDERDYVLHEVPMGTIDGVTYYAWIVMDGQAETIWMGYARKRGYAVHVGPGRYLLPARDGG